MPLVVQKFGGSSVATAQRIMAAARRAIRAKQAGNQVIVVVSARGDTTDDLIALAREITEQPPAREMDMLLATGEQISIALMAMAIQSLGVPAISFTGAQIGIVTDSFHTKARIKNISTRYRRLSLKRKRKSTTWKTMSVGISRKLNCVPVRSLNVRRQPSQRKTA